MNLETAGGIAIAIFIIALANYLRSKQSDRSKRGDGAE